METSQYGTDVGRDTTMCGDPKAWYPMRVTYSREMKVKAELDRLEIENFVPMTYRLVDADGENPHRELLPAINNLVFVHSTQERISRLKTSNVVLEPLRYLMDHTAEKPHEIMTVPDRQMENFMRGRRGRDKTCETLQTRGRRAGRRRLRGHRLRPCRPAEGDIEGAEPLRRQQS